MVSSLDFEYFRSIYQSRRDLFELSQGKYEQDKYQATNEYLRGLHFNRALEVGSGFCALSLHLASRCNELLCVDFVPKAIEMAASQTAKAGNIKLLLADLFNLPPIGKFDLIIFSELAYYFNEADLKRALRILSDLMHSDGLLFIVNWRGRSNLHPMHADQVIEITKRVSVDLGIKRVSRKKNRHYRMDLFKRSSR